jgi:hypothetical protein
MSGHAVVIRFCINVHTNRVVAMPVNKHRRQAREQFVSDLRLIGEVALWLDITEKGCRCSTLRDRPG